MTTDRFFSSDSRFPGGQSSDSKPRLNSAPKSIPLVEELSFCPDVDATLAKFSALPAVLLLESCLPQRDVGRYSFLCADPFELHCLQRATFGCNPFAELKKRSQQFSAIHIDGLPPFQGGAAGLLGYGLGHAWEQFPESPHDEFTFPAMTVGLYDWVIAWDHEQQRAWIISHGFPETEPEQRMQRAAKRMQWVRSQIESQQSQSQQEQSKNNRLTHKTERCKILAPQFSVPRLDGLTSDFSRENYLIAAEKVMEYIRAGDIFQANLSQRLLYPQTVSGRELLSRLRAVNPAPFAGYFAHDDWEVVSASPERFLQMGTRDVETRPIKGTRQRLSQPEADLYCRDELRNSEKDRSENVMIVDLLRNDLSRVCRPGTVRVPHLCEVETYETVHHLVSEIRGELNDGYDIWDLFTATFPGGSITGAPKVRAMQIISELEPTERGPYCGTLFYAGFDGHADSNILIRTFLCRNGWVQCSVGSGIIALSDPIEEYEETGHKAEGMLRALLPPS